MFAFFQELFDYIKDRDLGTGDYFKDHYDTIENSPLYDFFCELSEYNMYTMGKWIDESNY
jgi:hypothetical protein